MKNKYLRMLAATVVFTVIAGCVQISHADMNINDGNKEAAVSTTENQTTKAEQSTTEKTTKPAETKQISVKAPKIKKEYVKNKAAITWSKSNSKDKYEIWTSTKKNGSYKKVATTSGRNFMLKKLASGKLFYVKVRAYREVNRKIYKSSFSNISKVLTTVKLKKPKSEFAGTVTLNWEKGTNINGYCIQYSTDKKFKNKKTVKVRNKSTDTVNIYDLKQKKTYYIRIRTYKKEGKKTVLSMWSESRKVKVAGTSDIINGKFKSTGGYFENSVFFGDSVLQGFQIYCNNKGRTYLDKAKVMGNISYSLIAALQDESKYHPLYKGKHVAPQYITKSLSAEKVFLFFGINDIHNTGDPDRAFKDYKELINNIRKVNPEVKIHVISTSYPMKGSKDYVNYSKRIHKLNEKMRKYCDETDAEYIDIASYLSTSDGYLKSELCSDNFVHQKFQAYEIWDKVLRAYAWSYNNSDK